MPVAEITNPEGVNTPSEFLEFPNYYTTSMMRDRVREQFPNKLWPGEVAEVPAKGWFGEFGDALGDSYDQTMYDMSIGSAILRSDDDEAFSLLEEEYQNWKASPDDVKEYDILSGGFVGEVFGSIAPSVGAGIGAGVGASIVGTPVAGIWTGGSVMAALQGTTAKGGSMRNTYIAIRNKMDAEGDINFEKAYETARRVSNNDAVLAVGEAAVSTMVPVARVVPGIGKSITSRAAQKGLAELSFDAAVGATGSVLSDSYAESEGIDRGDKFENSFRAGLQEMIGGGIPSVIRTYSEYRNLKGGETLYKDFIAEPKRKGLPYTPVAGSLGGPTTSRIDPDIGPTDTDMVVPPRKPADGFDWSRENLDEDWDFLDAPEGRPRTPDELQAEKLRQATVGGDFTEEMAGDASRTTARGTTSEAEGFEAGRQSKINEEVKPGKKAAVVPVIDENGKLVGIRKATRAEVDDMVKRGANPILSQNQLFQKDNGPIMVRTRGGQWFEANADGTIDNLSPVEFDPFLSPDGLVLPLNEATDPDITSEDSRVTWKEAMIAFAEEIGSIQETFTLGTARVNILDDEFLKQEGPVPAFARILKREMGENPRLMKLIAPHMVQGELSAEGLAIIQNTEVPSDLDAMVKNRLTAQGANTEDRTKQRYFLTANGGKVAVQGNKFGTKTVGEGLAQKSLLTQIGTVERADELDRVIGERLEELAVARTRQNDAGLEAFDMMDIRKAEEKIKDWENQIIAKAQINKKGKTVPLGPKAIERKQEQIARQKELIANIRDKASADLPDQKLNPMLKSEHAILIEFLSDLNDPRVGPYPWENDPTGKIIEVGGKKYLLELEGIEGEEASLKLLQAKVTAVNFEVKSSDLEALTQKSDVTSGEDLLAKGMVQEGGLDVSIEVDDAIAMAAQEGVYAKELGEVDVDIENLKTLRNNYLNAIAEIIDGPEAPLDQLFRDLRKITTDPDNLLEKSTREFQRKREKQEGAIAPIPKWDKSKAVSETIGDDETKMWVADRTEDLTKIIETAHEIVENLLVLAKPNTKSEVPISKDVQDKLKALEDVAKDVLRGFSEPLEDTGKTKDTLENFHAAHAEFYIATNAFRDAMKEAVTSYASTVTAPKKPTVSATEAVSIKSKPLNRKLPVLNLKHFEAMAKSNLMGGASKWNESKGDFNTALQQETFRLAFAADIETVAWRIKKVRELQFLKLNLEPMLNEGRKGSKITVDPALKDLTNIETIEQVEDRIKKLINKAKLHRAWKPGDADGIHDRVSRYLATTTSSDLHEIESKASEAFGFQKGKFWKVDDPLQRSEIFEDPNIPTGRFYASRIKFREFLDALKHLLPKMDGVLYMNMPFNVGAIPQIFKALVKLAIAFSADTGKGFVDFAKAIRQKPDNEALKVAWEDSKTGRVRTTESYSSKVIKDIIKILKHRSEERAAHKQAVAHDGFVKAHWDRFIDRFHLQAYREDGLKAPVQALIKRYMVNQYIDLADIMARIARGSAGKPLNKAEVEDLIRKLPDTENAWYLLDGLETLTSERGMEMDKFQEELFKNMLDNKVDPVKFTRYLVAKHAFERNKQIAAKNKKTGDFQDVESDPYVDKDGKSQGGGSGMGNSTARKLIAEARAEGKQELYEKLNQTYVKPIIQSTLDMARDGGLIDEANHTKLTTFYKDYVPLRGLEDSDEIMRTTGNGIDVRGQEDIQKRAMGRRSEATEVIPYVFQQWSNMLMRTERVRVMQALANFIQANPNEDITIANPDYIRKLKQTKGYGEQVTWIQNPEWIKDTDLVGFKVGGKQHYMRFKNKELAHSLRNQGVSGLNSFLRVMAMGTRYLSRVNTQYNIGFTIPNFVRDIGLARMTLKSQDKEAMAKELANIRNIPGQFHHKLFRKKKGAVYDALAAAFRADYLAKRNPKDARNKALSAFFTSGDAKLDAEWDATYKEMKRFGGRIQFRGVLDMESRMDDLDALSKKITKLSSKVGKEGKDNFVKDWAINVKELLEDVNTAVESSTRLAVYKLARDRGATPQRAAYLSRNSTINFTRRGKAGAGLNSLFMFYNASAQGGYQVMSNFNHTKKGKQIAYQIAATGFAVEMFNQMFSGEDEEGVSLYDKIPEWKKNTNLIIMSPFTGGKAFSFPLPYGYNAIHYTGQKIFKVGKAAYLGSADVPGAQGAGAAAGDLASTFSSAFNPIGGSTNLARMITPDVGDVIIDINANKDWKGADIYPEPSPFAPYPGPDSSRYWSTVNPGLKYLARKMNEITGGDEVSSGGYLWSVDVSPETLEQVFSHIFGGAGSTAMRFEKMLHGMAEGKAPKLNDIPIARRFIAAPSSFYELEKFKQLRALSEQASDMHKLYLENGEYEDAKKYREANDILFKIHPRVKNTGSQIRKINKAMRIVGASDGLSPQDKAIQLRRLKLQKNTLMGKTHSEFVDLLLPME